MSIDEPSTSKMRMPSSVIVVPPMSILHALRQFLLDLWCIDFHCLETCTWLLHDILVGILSTFGYEPLHCTFDGLAFTVWFSRFRQCKYSRSICRYNYGYWTRLFKFSVGSMINFCPRPHDLIEYNGKRSGQHQKYRPHEEE